jgi:hypothetical protein
MQARSIAVAFAAVAAVLLPLAAGEEGAHEKALKQQLRALDQLSAALEKVRDAESAEAARPELRKAVAAWSEAKTKLAELPPPDKAEKDRLAKEYKKKMDAATLKFFTEVGRVRGFPAGKQVLEEIKTVGGP